MSTLVFFVLAAVSAWLIIKLITPSKPKQPELKVTVIYGDQHPTDDPAPDQDHDNWEGSFWEVSNPRKISARLRLHYKDGKGSITDRDVDLTSYGAWEGGGIMICYCHLRQATRTFRTDRIISCIDRDTGEIINDLYRWLEDKWQASPDRSMEKVVEESWDLLRVLYYVGKADGRLTQKEREIIRGTVLELANHPELTKDRIDDFIDGIGSPLTLTAFKQAFGRIINRDRPQAEKTLALSEQMVATEKKVSASEQEALDYMRERLNRK